MNKKEIISCQDAMQPTGPYSQAVAFDSLIFVAGQTAVHPETGQIVAGGIEAETRQAIDNLSAILNAAGSSLDQVLKTTVFLADMNDFAVVNSIYTGYFPTSPPARTCLQVSAMPKGARIEIEAVAYRTGHGIRPV